MDAVVLQLVGGGVGGWPTVLVAAFVGGALGAAVGAVPALSLSGVVLAVGEVTAVVSRGPTAATGATLSDWVALGPLLGPHVAFAGGAAAAAYGARKGVVPADRGYFPAKNLTTPLGLRPALLAVGGLFGVLGVLLRRTAAAVGLPLSTVAFAVVASAFAHRLAFGYSLLGVVRTGDRFDMSPFDADERRPTAPDGGTVAGGTDRLAVEPWQPDCSGWPTVAGVGLVAGLLAASVAVLAGTVLLPFGLALALVGLDALPVDRVDAGPEWLADALDRLPPVYHTALLGAVGTTLVAGAVPALVAGGVLGLVTGLVAEVAQRSLYAHGSTHVDPGFAAVLVVTLPVGIVAAVAVPGPVPLL